MTLNIDGISAGYQGEHVLRIVAVGTLAPASVTGLIGPNASGKSTPMKTISGFVTPTAGKITIDGTDLAALKRKDRARLVSYMPQAFGSNAILLDIATPGNARRLPHYIVVKSAVTR